MVRPLGKQNIQQNVRISDTGYGDSVRRLAWPNKHLLVEVVALLGSKNMAPWAEVSLCVWYYWLPFFPSSTHCFFGRRTVAMVSCHVARIWPHYRPPSSWNWGWMDDMEDLWFMTMTVRDRTGSLFRTLTFSSIPVDPCRWWWYKATVNDKGKFVVMVSRKLIINFPAPKVVMLSPAELNCHKPNNSGPPEVGWFIFATFCPVCFCFLSLSSFDRSTLKCASSIQGVKSSFDPTFSAQFPFLFAPTHQNFTLCHLERYQVLIGIEFEFKHCYRTAGSSHQGVRNENVHVLLRTSNWNRIKCSFSSCSFVSPILFSTYFCNGHNVAETSFLLVE